MARSILIFILVLFIARAFWRVFDGVIEGMKGSGDSAGGRTPASSVAMVRDPVCGTFVLPSRAVTLSSGGRQWHFCSARCRDAFSAGAIGQGRSA